MTKWSLVSNRFLQDRITVGGQVVLGELNPKICKQIRTTNSKMSTWDPLKRVISWTREVGKRATFLAMRSSSFQILQLKIFTSLIRPRKIKEARKDWFQPDNLTSLYILAFPKSKTNLRHPGIGLRRVVNKKEDQTKNQIITPNMLHLPKTKAKISQVQRAKKVTFREYTRIGR